MSARPQTPFRTALAWSLAMNGGQQLITTGLTFLLAAILGPEAFGTVAMAMIYVLFVRLFLEQGLGTAVVQRRDLDPAHLDAAFWMVFGGSLLLLGASLWLSDWWAGVNRLPDLGPVIRGLSLTIPLQGLTVVQQAVLQRDMDFKSLAIRTNGAALAGGCVAVAMALSGYGLWSLVAQHVTSSAVALVLLWSLSQWRPRLRFTTAATRDLIGFSSGAFLGRIGIFFSHRTDALLMGLFFGPVAVGIYRLADRLIDLAVNLAARSIRAVALPEFSRFQDQPDELRRSAKRCMRTGSTLALPLLGVLAGSSGAIMTLLGPRWGDAALPLQILCVVGLGRALALITGPLMRATGRPHAHAVLVWSLVVPSALAFWLVAVWLQDAATQQQAAGIAVSRAVLLLALSLPLHWWLALRILKAPVLSLIAPTLPGLVAGCAALATSALLQASGLSDALEPRLGALLVLASCGAVAAFAVLALEPGLRRRVLRLARGRSVLGGAGAE